MLYYPWRLESELLGNEQTYISKFCETNVQAVVEQNKSIFEPDSDAVIEALEALRNNDMAFQSYDPINDQENEDLQSQLLVDQESSNNEESFNNLPSDHLGYVQNSNESSPTAVATYI